MTTKEIITAELEELARLFEWAGPEATWTGSKIAEAIRERIKNHHFIENEFIGRRVPICKPPPYSL